MKGVNGPCADVTLRAERSSMVITRVDDFRLRAVRAFHPEIDTVLGVAPSRLGHRRAVRTCVRTGRGVTGGRARGSAYILGCRSSIAEMFKRGMGSGILCFDDRHVLRRKVCLRGNRVILTVGKRGAPMYRMSRLGVLKARGRRGTVTTAKVTTTCKIPMSIVHEALGRFRKIRRHVRCITRGGKIMCCGSSGKAGPSTTVGKVRTVGHPAILVNKNCSGSSTCSR